MARARFAGRESFFLVHVEARSSRRGEFPARMSRYFARLYEKHGLPVYPVAVLSYDRPETPGPDGHEVVFPDLQVLAFRYRTIQPNRLSWRDFLERENPVAAALMAKMKIATQDRPKVKAACLRLLATLRLDPARMRLISGFVESCSRLDAEEDRISREEIATFRREAQEKAMEIITSRMEEGLEQGWASPLRGNSRAGSRRGGRPEAAGQPLPADGLTGSRELPGSSSVNRG